jgi:sulfur carrier protein ThiS
MEKKTATLLLVGMLKGYCDGKSELQISAGKTVRQVLGEVGIPAELVALVTVNGRQEDKNYLVQAGDLVKLMALMGGG